MSRRCGEAQSFHISLVLYRIIQRLLLAMCFAFHSKCSGLQISQTFNIGYFDEASGSWSAKHLMNQKWSQIIGTPALAMSISSGSLVATGFYDSEIFELEVREM